MSWAFEYVGDYNYGWPQADQASWWWAQLAKTHKNSSNYLMMGFQIWSVDVIFLQKVRCGFDNDNFPIIFI